ncbi:MAG: hypothetical protein K6T83_22400 [Alicyclobacillus sp.]|nr:hypothetical protein [Alicyclobacillus sp.]
MFATGRLLPNWRVGVAVEPLSLAAIHLQVLGSMLTVAFGVMYQIILVAFQASPVPRHVLYWQLPVHLASVVVMVMGFLQSIFALVGIGGTVLLVNTVAYFLLVGRSYLRARNKTPVHRSIMAPFTALRMVILTGLFQAFLPSHVSGNVIAMHVILGGLAFWGLLVLNFSYKLIPMFIISHGYRASLPLTVVPYGLGIVCWLLFPSIPDHGWRKTVMLLGALLLLLGVAHFVTDVISMIRARKKRRIVWPMPDAFAANLLFVAGHIGFAISMADARAILALPVRVPVGVWGAHSIDVRVHAEDGAVLVVYEYRFSKRAGTQDSATH